MHRRMDGLRSERGAVTVLVAVSMLTLLAFLALAIDLGMLYVAHNDAQRAADAAALAGASAFLEQDAAVAAPTAHSRAMEYARRNTFQNGPIDSTEVDIRVVPESSLVGVTVQRDTVRTLFARVLGIRTVPIGAYAAAEAVEAGNARCLKPFAVPDMWNDANGDANQNRLWDDNEDWQYGDSPQDYYSPYTGPSGSPQETGYGSGFRNSSSYQGDFGRQIKIKVTNPQDISAPSPGIFLPWRLPPDSSQGQCEKGGGGGQSSGAATYRRNICTCNTSPISLNQPYEIETGNMVGPTFQGTGELIDQDPNAAWDDVSKTVVGSSLGSGWMNSPRVVRIALFAPGQITKSGMQTIEFNNFALMFIEAQNSNKDPVMGRFLYYVSGNDAPGGTTGSLIKTLKLVK
jgi:putative Flp pilus-assembly TadE/G-like protein